MATPHTVRGARAPAVGDPEVERRRRWEELALGYRLFAALRWGDLGDGHISARDPECPDHFWLLAHGVSFDRATVDDLVLVAPDGTATDRDGAPAPINTAGYDIHHPIHEARPDIVSAAHVHTHWGTPFSAERRPIEPISQESTIFFDDHALFDDEEVQILSPDGGRRIARALSSYSAVVLANHGLLTVGSSVAGAVGGFVLLERVAEVHMKAREAKAISPAAARTARADLIRDDLGSRVFRHLVMRHLGVD